MTLRRPVGLISLAVVAALLCPALAYFAIILFVNVIPLLWYDPHKPDYYPLGYVLILLPAVACWLWRGLPPLPLSTFGDLGKEVVHSP